MNDCIFDFDVLEASLKEKQDLFYSVKRMVESSLPKNNEMVENSAKMLIIKAIIRGFLKKSYS